MRRRDFVAFLSGAIAWATAVRAKEPRRVIGILGSASYGTLPGAEAAFIEGLRAAGFIEGKNISIEWRWAEGQYNRLSSLAAELVGRNVAVIVALSVPSAFAAKAATKTIPIVFVSGADPVKIGLVESFSRPNGNLTGMTGYVSVAGPKRVELLHELLPGLNTIALLGNPANANFQADVPDTRTAAAATKRPLEVPIASTESELEAAFVTMVQRRVGGLVVMPDPVFISRRERVVELAAHHAIPAIYPLRGFTDIGGLMSYGSSVVDLKQQTGVYVGKILKGVKPADLPIQQSTKVELVINLKTAKALGLTVPSSLLARAEEVIE